MPCALDRGHGKPLLCRVLWIGAHGKPLLCRVPWIWAHGKEVPQGLSRCAAPDRAHTLPHAPASTRASPRHAAVASSPLARFLAAATRPRRAAATRPRRTARRATAGRPVPPTRRASTRPTPPRRPAVRGPPRAPTTQHLPTTLRATPAHRSGGRGRPLRCLAVSCLAASA